MKLRTDECRLVAERLGAYAEGRVKGEEAAALEEHLRGCDTCRQGVENFRAVAGLLNGTLAPGRLSKDFAQKTGQRLHAITTGQREPLEVEYEELPAAPAPTMLDALQSHMGSAPWWIISGAFHALLILLVFLIGMVVMQAKQNDVVIVTNLEKQEKPPEPEKKLERDIIEKPVPIQESEVVAETSQVVVTHEVVEFADHEETDNNAESTNEARGEDGISDAFLGGQGTVSALGVGGGGRSGAFGRPNSAGGRLKAAMKNGGGKATESAVDKALEWLARNQEAEGHWDATKHGGNKCDTAMTGFALLAFLGAGHTERVGKYKDNVRRAVEWLGKHQNDEGLVYNNDAGAKGYNHSIAGIALAEAAGMGRVKKTMEIAQKAVDYSVNIHQCGDGSEKRGWRYGPKQEGDLSNCGWFIMQLKSAKVAGLTVPHGGFEGATWFLDHVEYKGLLEKYPEFRTGDYDNGRHRYGYTGPGATGRLTAIGCLNRLFLGTPVDELRGGIEWMAKAGMPKRDRVDLYYWYYGTLCTFQYGEDVWKEWNTNLKDALLPTQRVGGPEDGSWDPAGAYAGNWGRVGQTAIAALCLEVYYRYLPMYR